MSRARRVSKRQRKFAATCRVLHMLKPRRLEGDVPVGAEVELEDWMFGGGND